MSYLSDLIQRRNHLHAENLKELDPRARIARAALIAAIERGITDANRGEPDAKP